MQTTNAMTSPRIKSRMEYLHKIDLMDTEKAKGLLKALVWGNVGRTIGLNEAVRLTGGSKTRLMRLLEEGAIREEELEEGAQKRKINLCDCLLNASIITLR